MANPDIYKRPAFPNRPWISGKAYDQYSSKRILHCDAFIFAFGGMEYLAIDWREGGHKRIALDGWLIEPDGLTPVESYMIEAMRNAGVARYWGRTNSATMARVHRTVLAQPERMATLGDWARVTVQAHYVYAPDSECGIAADRNHWTAPKPYTPRAPLAPGLSELPHTPRKNALPDWL